MSVESDIKDVVSTIFKTKLIEEKIMSYFIPVRWNTFARPRKINNEILIPVEIDVFNRYNMKCGTLRGLCKNMERIFFGINHITVIYDDCVELYDRFNYNNINTLKCEQNIFKGAFVDNDKFITIDYNKNTSILYVYVHRVVQNELRRSNCLTSYLQNNYIDFTYKNNILFFTMNDMYHGQIVINNYTFDTRYMIKAC